MKIQNENSHKGVIPKELIKETVDGYHILRTDIQHIFDEPIDVEFVLCNIVSYKKLKAIIPSVNHPIICMDMSYGEELLKIIAKVQKEQRPMNQIEMANYCYQESQKKGKVLFVKWIGIATSNIKPYWYYNYGESGTELFRLTWNGIEFFDFPQVEV